MIYLLISAVVLLSMVTAISLWRHYRLKRFINRLANNLREQTEQTLSLDFADVPALMLPLYTAFKALLRQLPANIGRDPLTGLPNRASLKKTLVPLMPLTQGALVLLNIEQFRFVNDLFGFHTGDKVLQAVALRLRQFTPQPRFIARMDGDEFLLFFGSEVAQPQLLALQQLVQQPYLVGNAPIGLKVKIGVLQLATDHADVSQMLRRVDLALKKAIQPPFIAYYQQGDDQANQREMSIINSLPKALQQQQLYLVYQPKQALAGGQCVQAEALMRWEHPQLGHISPAEFIPLAECAGMLGLVSDWVLDGAVAQLARWQQQGVHLPVAINLSSSDFEQDVVSKISAKLAEYQVDARLLALELTERTLVANLADTQQKLRELRALGIKVAIDDFGTGHSSLAYLKDLPVDEIKIDKAFLDGLFTTNSNALKILRCSIQLSHQLGFSVTVEGVETAEQRELLVKLGADVIQGLIYSQPMRAAELVYHARELHLFSNMDGDLILPSD
ncbi:putative bifunctional diguanylate cyclase/phosphodiesterase [Shewanella sp.]|uniref:putative bifunctional diguanylate cyclase/phosphodiesterase n=1 Tax=Shewanella sp. TaxID=50422 RepID=UPI003A98858C